MRQGYSIKHNGSKWYGEAPDSLATLAYRLKTYKLSKDFRDICIHPYKKGIRLFGNFTNLSAAFSIDVYNPFLITYFRKLLAFNIQHSKELK